MKRFIYLFIFILSVQMVSAQSGGKGSISGVLADSVTNQVVEFAAVALWNPTKAVDGTLTDMDGKFKFNNLPNGTYKIIISFVGYKPYALENIEINEQNQNANLGRIQLLNNNIQLQEVKVTAQSNLVEDKIDRLVYNADKDISNRGGTAEEVLRKVPMLSIDLDGNVELRGSQNIRVLINNKPSSIFASSVGEALKQIPSDQIKSVEVITSPSAKYEGEGTAGIVNIILKKNTLAGVTGMVSSGVGYMGSFLNTSLNLRDKKWGLTFNGGGRYSYNIKTTGLNTRTSVINDTPTYLEQSDSNKGLWNNGNYRATFDYDFDAKTNLTISYSGRSRANGGKGDQVTQLFDANRETIFSNTRYIDQINKGLSSDIDLTFMKKYANPVQELSIMGQFSNSNRNQNFIATQNSIAADSSRNKGIDREYSIKLDYVQPLGKKLKWEMGAKAESRGATSDGLFYSYDAASAQYQLNSLRSNFLDYDQTIGAGYSSFTLELPKKWGIQAGVRYERTTVTAQFKEKTDVEIPDYANWLPSVTLSKRFEKGSSVKASYSQRIQRPSIRFLNPFVDYSNNSQISYGNPTLSPELVDLAEIGYSTFFGQNSINFSVFSRIEDNSITSVSNVSRTDDGRDITETTFLNIGINKRYGVNLSYNLNPNKNWRFGGGINTDYTYMDNRRISNQGWNAGFNLNTSYNLPKGWAVSAFGFYRTPRVILQGQENGFYFHGITTKKDIANKKGSLGLSLENPFVKTINFNSSFEDRSNPEAYFIQENLRQIYRRSIRLDFEYRFGKMDANKNGLFRRRGNGNNNNNNDQEEDGQMMMR